MKRTILIYLGLFAGTLTISNLQLTYAQSRSAEAVVRSVADRVIEHTAFSFIDPKTKTSYTSAKDISPQIELKVESQYNRWEYANGVLNIGMMELSRVLDDAKYAGYAAHNFDFIFSNQAYLYQRYMQNPKAEWAAFYRMKALDDCGALAAALAGVNEKQLKKEYQQYLDKAAGYILKQQSRLADGTLSRVIPRDMTIWADDLYMSVPFLARMGKQTHQTKYFDEAIKQVLNFNKYLYDINNGSYFHCWYSDNKTNGVAHWLRCNGWIAMAQVELLKALPDDYPKRQELVGLLLRQIVGFSRYQDQSGLWHQVIDKSDSYLETSGTAMFVYAVATAVNKGWINKTYLTIAKEGWKGLSTKITTTGEVQDVCIGTGIADNISFYYNRPKVLNDFHVLGPVILAGSAMIIAEKGGQSIK